MKRILISALVMFSLIFATALLVPYGEDEERELVSYDKQKGEMTITSRIYPIDKDYGVSFKADGKAIIKNINKWRIG